MQARKFAVRRAQSSRSHRLWDCEIGRCLEDFSGFEDHRIRFLAVPRHVGEVSTQVLREVVKKKRPGM